jgi:hypothetical protein
MKTLPLLRCRPTRWVYCSGRQSRISVPFRLTSDGPFAETKEQLGGFILIDASDLNDAIHVASGIPLARLGSIEVRPIMELKQP